MLRDDSHGAVTPDDLQRFTYALCHLYGRAAKVVSKPAPVYWAHTAALMGRYYTPGFREVNETWEVGSTTSAGSAGSATFVPTQEAIRKTGYYA